MGTKIYGSSDDLIEIEGDIDEEIGNYGTDDRETGNLLAFSDGTILDVKYGKPTGGIWAITLLRKGDLFDKIVVCEDEEAKPYSDIAYLKDGIHHVFSAKEYKRIK